MTLLELAERCEKATGPDRALDYDIAHFATRAHLANHGKAPAYTASLDAAMTLVPEGWLTHLTEYNGRVWDALLHGPLVNGKREFASSRTKGSDKASATPALALCAAALRALAAMAEADTPPAP